MTLDELVVKLFLDPTGFTKGQAQATAASAKMAADVTKSAGAAEQAVTDANAASVVSINKFLAAVAKTAPLLRKSVKETGEATKSAGEQFDRLARNALTLFAILSGFRSVSEFTSQIVNLDAAVGRLAHNLGSTPQTLSAIGRSVERAGGTFEGATSGIQGFVDAFEAMRTGNGTGPMKELAQLQALGGKPITFGADWHKSLMQIGDDLHALDQKGDAALADYLGRKILGDPGLVNWAKRGSAAMMADEAASPKITPEQAANAQKLQASLAAVKQEITGIGEAFLLDFGPSVVRALEYVKDQIDKHKAQIEQWGQSVSKWFSEHEGDIRKFGVAIGELVKFATGVAIAFASQSPMVQALEAFAVLMGGRVLNSISLVSSAIGALAAIPVPAALAALLAARGVQAWGDAKNTAKLLSGPNADNSVFVDPETGVAQKVAPDAGNQVTGQAKPGVGWFQKFLGKIGLGDKSAGGDSRVDDAIIGTEKQVRELKDIIKAQQSATGTDAAGGVGGGGVMGAIHRTLRNAGAAAGGGFNAGGASRPAKGALAANQKEAYAAALAEGLSPTAARALVANMSGEGLAVPHDRHWDGTHYAQGIVQWDPTRTAAIAAQFGKQPMNMSVAEQTKAAIWEMKKKYPTTWRALQGNNGPAMIDALVDDYERPGNRGRAKAQRYGYYRGFNPGAGDGTGTKSADPTVYVNGTPSTSGPVGDQAALDAETRARGGRAQAGDAALLKAYHEQQNAPKAAEPPHKLERNPDGTLTTANRTFGNYLKITRPMFANKSIGAATNHHPGQAPVKVEVTKAPLDPARQKLADAMNKVAPVQPGTLGHLVSELAKTSAAMRASSAARKLTSPTGSGAPQSAIHSSMLNMARDTHLSRIASTIHNTRGGDTNTSETKVGAIHVYSQATDAKGIAADLRPHLERSTGAARGDTGLA